MRLALTMTPSASICSTFAARQHFDAQAFQRALGALGENFRKGRQDARAGLHQNHRGSKLRNSFPSHSERATDRTGQLYSRRPAADD
jgi:hypothetical protein